MTNKDKIVRGFNEAIVWTKFRNIWCPNCKMIEPMVADAMEAGKLNDHDALDLVCGKCHYIVATLHEDPRPEVKV